jgi:MFS family permease
VFLASAVTLILEIVAARILAPHIGVSVYTWTSIIGVILAGISLGNWLGGVLADRGGGRTMLGLILLLGAATTLIVPLLANWAPGLVSGLPILARIVLLTLILFFVPSTLLAMVSPIVIKLTLRSLEKTGSVAGRIYAVSTAGAILGTFLTGFVLIQAFGSRPTVYGLAAVLTVLAVVAGTAVAASARAATWIGVARRGGLGICREQTAQRPVRDREQFLLHPRRGAGTRGRSDQGINPGPACAQLHQAR